MTKNSQLSTTGPKNKNKLSKQIEQEQNHRNGDHMEGYQWGGGGGERGKGVGKNRRIRSITGSCKIDRGWLRIEWEIEKPKNLYV